MKARVAVDQALAALAGRLADPDAATARQLAVAVDYVMPLGGDQPVMTLPVTLMPGMALNGPDTVIAEPFAAQLARVIDDWISREAPAPGHVEFSFQWWDASSHRLGSFDYPRSHTG